MHRPPRSTASLAILVAFSSVGASGCHKETPGVGSPDAAREAAPLATSVLDDPLGGAFDSHRKPYEESADDKVALIDPNFVVVGDPFVILGSGVNAGCAPDGEWAPPDFVTFLGDELIAPKFPTPSRTYFAHYRATAKGKTSIKLTCTRDSPGHEVATRALTILDPAEAAAFVDIDIESYAADLARALETGRAGALACFAADLARDPKVRGAGSMRVWTAKGGATSIPINDPDYAGAFDGLSTRAADCVRKTMAKAFTGQRIDVNLPSYGHSYLKTAGTESDIHLRFEMYPKTFDAKACDHYRERWTACATKADSSELAEIHDGIVARQNVATTDDGRRALAFACGEATRDLELACQ